MTDTREMNIYATFKKYNNLHKLKYIIIVYLTIEIKVVTCGLIL